MSTVSTLAARALKAQVNARQYLRGSLASLKPFGGAVKTVVPGDVMRINTAAVHPDNPGPLASADLKVGAVVVVHRFTDSVSGADLPEYRRGAAVNVYFYSADNADWLKGGRRGVRHFPIDARALVPASLPKVAHRGMRRTVQEAAAAASKPATRKRTAKPAAKPAAADPAAAREAVIAKLTDAA